MDERDAMQGITIHAVQWAVGLGGASGYRGTLAQASDQTSGHVAKSLNSPYEAATGAHSPPPTPSHHRTLIVTSRHNGQAHVHKGAAHRLQATRHNAHAAQPCHQRPPRPVFPQQTATREVRVGHQRLLHIHHVQLHRHVCGIRVLAAKHAGAGLSRATRRRRGRIAERPRKKKQGPHRAARSNAQRRFALDDRATWPAPCESSPLFVPCAPAMSHDSLSKKYAKWEAIDDVSVVGAAGAVPCVVQWHGGAPVCVNITVGWVQPCNTPHVQPRFPCSMHAPRDHETDDKQLNMQVHPCRS
jgi:hypothetical protein